MSEMMEAKLVFPALGAVRRGGGAPDRVLARLGRDVTTSSVSVPKLPESTMRRFFEGCADELSDPLFGLRLADEIPLDSYSITRYLALTSATLVDAIATVARYSSLIDGVSKLGCERSGHELVITLRGSDPEGTGIHGALTFFRETIRSLRHMTKHPIVPTSAWMPFESRDKRRVKEALGVGVLEVAGAASGFVLGADVAKLPITTADPALHEILCQHATLLASSRSVTKDYRGVLQEILRQQFLEGDEVSVSQAARKLGTSVRTFQRRLLIEGSSFHDVVDAVRRELACQLLARREHSVGDVAYTLQYSDVSAFIRAFRRWTGTTPGVILKSSEAHA